MPETRLRRFLLRLDFSRAGSIRRTGERRAARSVMFGTAVVLLLLWSSIAGFVAKSYHTTLSTERLVVERMTTVVEEQTRHFFSLVQFFLAGTERALLSAPYLDPRDNPEFLRLIEGLRERTGSDLMVRLINANGDSFDVLGQELTLGNRADREYFRAQVHPAERGFHIGKPVLGRASKRVVLPISYPLPSNAGGFGMIVVSVPVQVVNGLYEQGRPRPGGSIALVHRDGTVMARAPYGDSFVGRSIAGGTIWKGYLSTQVRGSVVIGSTAIDKSPRVTGFSAMYDLPLVVVVSSATDEVLANWRFLTLICITAGLVLTCASVVGMRHLIRLLAKLALSRAEAEELAWQDPLTGLPNRRMVYQCIDDELARAKREGAAVTVIYLDLDGFKDINDTLGHHAGDILLIECAQRMRGCIREADVLARLGGDEFTVVLYGSEGDVDAERVAAAILASLSEPFIIDGEGAYITASIGISVFPGEASSAAELMRQSDQAMYAAKSDGKGTWRYYTPAMQQCALSRLALQRELRQAFRMNEFTLFYQPIVDLNSSTVHKAEALLRWRHPTRGIVPPSDFIRVMEDNGLIVDAGNEVFREAARQVLAWRCVIDPRFQLTVNKSPVQFRNEESGSAWVDYLEALGLPGDAVAVEITEGMLLEPTPAACRILGDFQRAGIQVALDDFGTGYSSLAYLRKFDIDYVKIDRAFVATIGDPEGAALCRAIIAMAHSLGLKVVAEGVEEEYQLRILREMRCDFGQGYLFSPPVPAEQFISVVTALTNHDWTMPSPTSSGVAETTSDTDPVQQMDVPVV